MTADDEAAWQAVREPALHTLTRRRGLPLTVLRPDHRLVPLNGSRLRTPGLSRPAPLGFVCLVAYRAELRPTLREVAAHLVDPQARVMSRRRVTGGLSVEAAEALGVEDTRLAVAAARAAAARFLDRPVEITGRGVLVGAVLGSRRRHEHVPLRPGDRIVAVEQSPTSTLEDLLPRLAHRDVAQVTVQRSCPAAPGGTGAVVGTTRVERLVRRRDGRWGLRVSTEGLRIDTPLDADVDLPPELAGPSLGLATALAIVDGFTGGTLGRSGHVVATGTITPDGRVGQVGGVELKAAAVARCPQVRTFLVPSMPDRDLATVRRAAGTAAVLPVADLREAVAVLRSR